MPINILMPALSPTMTEGTLARWLVKEGDTVNSGDVMAEIETDKATMEVEAVDEGTIAKILISDGTEGVAVNAVIAILLEEGEDASALDKAPAPAVTAAPEATAAVTEPISAPAAAAPASAAEKGNRVFASPLARRMAAQENIDLAGVQGSGPHGRIVKADIENAQAKGAGKVTAAAKPEAAPVAKAPAAASSGPNARELADMLGMEYKLEPLSSMRKVIASRLSESKQTVPHFYLSVDCELDKLLSFRKELNAKDGVKISVNDFVIRAVALALKKVPAANASFSSEGILTYKHADISVAVATPSGLITPIIKAAEGKGLATISGEMKDLAVRARDGKLKPEEYQGGTFSVSNLGMFGIKDFSAIINPPQGCILAVGAGEQRPVVKDGALAIATVMTCTLSVDHRVVDGAVGAEFMAAFKALVEDPLSMLL
ncbi:pyruvate dehydrogenase complex dihydrolipoamide acetyltransferase [Kiloniella laminariae]|uniref:Acetyltransferase component of pyruvate dehydrogenase complex n=1 Tax=Kiloniella laminariae TaxID=454162 RepID=A0ABT4LLU7_9PROT|nr:pyruvate dehydrogenase complex dihydrolipoamide acetyltransferase [Kiloniella laminariae]MCZ4282062.1 pyruvate dehydrogenase complex dihydrolipoamide acetyltransferase [Kiloniella laminariae]